MFYDPARTLISDTECYPNFWSIGFRRVSDGKTLVMEHSHRKQIDRQRLFSLLSQNLIVGYNWQGYDQFMCAFAAQEGTSNAALKHANDRIIVGRLRYWEVEDALDIRISRKWRFIDLIEPQPNAFASLKTLMGRLHAPKMQDLPYDPDTVLTEEQMDNVLSYMGNDKHGTHLLFDGLHEALQLRDALSKQYSIPFLSKSDSQIGEAIVKTRVERLTGTKVQKIPTPAGTTFKYKIPDYLRFETPELAGIVDRLRDTDFYVQTNGKVELPDWLNGRELTLGDTTYAMGIGGLHSTESNRAVHSDEENLLIDFDVASYYPAIILNSGLYPKSLGPHFLAVYRQIRDERVVAKRAGDKVKAEGMKIALNGVFGKLGSPYSIVYAPHLMIAVTLTGQLSLLMLIERAEQAAIPVVSANTDGVVFRCPRDRMDDLTAITKQWEQDTGFELEDTEYRSLYNASVNSYIAVKPDGTAKIKGPVANPWRSGDMRGMLMKNPQATICSDAVVDLITKGVPIEQTIRANTDIRSFVTVVKVDGGAIWTGDNSYLGKVVRYIWTREGGAEIIRKKGHWKTGTQGKVPKTDGCRPMMDLPDEFPDDIDYDRYIAEANQILVDIGYYEAPKVVKPLRVYKHSAVAWWAVAV